MNYENFFKKLTFSKIGLLVRKQKRRFKFFRPVIAEYSDFLNARPFNHYESPYPNIVEIHKHEKEIFVEDKEIKDIDFNIDRQFELISVC